VRRGFLWPSADLYGGFSGFYDYGHNGAALKRKWEQGWLDYFLRLGENYHLVEATHLLPEAALKASGHVDLFTDVLVECTRCHEVHRADQLLEEKLGRPFEGLSPAELGTQIQDGKVPCPKCGGILGEPRAFNMMFPVRLGTSARDLAYLRPETAQGAYLNFKREFESLRRRLPLGLAIVGRAYRNEISPRQGTYRMREFQQAELQIFFDPATVDEGDLPEGTLRVAFAGDRGGKTVHEAAPAELHARGIPRLYLRNMAAVQAFYLEVLRVPPERFRFAELSEKERAFYNRVHFDVELDQDTLGGFREVGGVHYRTDHDLGGHERASKQTLSVNLMGRRFTPHVLELSFGVDRNVWALLELGYARVEDRTTLRLPPRLAPVTVGVFPLVKKDGLAELGQQVYGDLRRRFDCYYDESDAVGRRYARLDEIGTPFCVTVDYQSKEDGSVTLRHRDTREQRRVPIAGLAEALAAALDAW
jgi:glycyl-tRNA synthetase